MPRKKKRQLSSCNKLSFGERANKGARYPSSRLRARTRRSEAPSRSERRKVVGESGSEP